MPNEQVALPTDQQIVASALQIHHELIEDYVHGEVPRVLEASADCLLALRRESTVSGRDEIVTVNVEHELFHWFQDDASATGWTGQAVPIPEQQNSLICGLVGMVHTDRLYVLVQFSADSKSSTQNILLLCDENMHWSQIEPADDSPLQQLQHTTCCEVRSRRGHASMFVGLEADTRRPFILEPGPDQRWVDHLKSMPDWTPPTEKTLQLVDLNGEWPSVIGQRVFDLVGEPDTWSHSEAASAGAPLSSEIVKTTQLPEADGSPPSPDHVDFLTLDAVGVLSRYRGVWSDGHFDLERTDLSGRPDGDGPHGVNRFDVRATPDGVVVYSIEAETNELWLLPQADAAAESLTLGKWIHLGDRSRGLATSPSRHTGQALYLVNADDLTLSHLEHDIGSGLWFETTVQTGQLPSANGRLPDPRPTSSYVTEVLALSSSGAPAPNAPLHIEADRPVSFRANGKAYRVGPGRPAPCSVDAAGRLMIMTEAQGLTTAALRIRCPDLHATDQFETCRPDARTHTKLARIDRADIHAVTGGPHGPILPDADAEHLATMIQRVGQSMLSQSPDAKTSIAPAAREAAPIAWEIDLEQLRSQPTVDHLRATSAIRQLSAAETRARSDELQGLFSGIGHVVHVIKHVAAKAKKVVIHAVEDSLHVVVHFAESEIRLVAKTVEELGQAIEGVIATVAQAIAKVIGAAVDIIKKIIEFLRELFNWQDIVQTARHLASAFEATMTHLGNGIERDGKRFIHEEFKLLRGDLKNVKATWRKAAKDVARSSADAPESEEMSAHREHSVRCNYATHHMHSHMLSTGFEAGETDTTLTLAADKSPFAEIAEELQRALETSLEDLGELSEDLVAWFNNLDWSDPAKLIESIVDGLLVVLADSLQIALDVTELVLDLLMRAAKAVLTAIVDLLTLKIEVPILSALFRQITGQDLTVLTLVTLAVAAPVTVLYKLFNDGHAPFSSNAASGAQLLELSEDEQHGTWSDELESIALPPEVARWVGLNCHLGDAALCCVLTQLDFPVTQDKREKTKGEKLLGGTRVVARVLICYSDIPVGRLKDDVEYKDWWALSAVAAGLSLAISECRSTPWKVGGAPSKAPFIYGPWEKVFMVCQICLELLKLYKAIDSLSAHQKAGYPGIGIYGYSAGLGGLVKPFVYLMPPEARRAAVPWWLSYNAIFRTIAGNTKAVCWHDLERASRSTASASIRIGPSASA